MTNRRAAREDQHLETANRLFKERGYYSTSAPPPADKLRWALHNHAVAMMDRLDLVADYLREYRNLPPRTWRRRSLCASTTSRR